MSDWHDTPEAALAHYQALSAMVPQPCQQQQAKAGGIPCDAPAEVITRVDCFAEMEGRTWRAKLRELWASGRDTGLLREACNYIGPSGLDAYKPGRMVSCMSDEACA
ncbi:hypothetical protein E4V01_25150 [Methylorubrum sp. Q1]|uniref:hypothetical protein n=1 Tax=Methylorubrum sp. Q1 TaxID=2562453 RepID=UPI001075F2B8|nr:hypothetical protein [Methylorubrum sp. Q1]TFZ54471.1 hypothetical protein E4V01_25150 [Methylorubrum sp. Q1]